MVPVAFSVPSYSHTKTLGHYWTRGLCCVDCLQKYKELFFWKPDYCISWS